MRKTAAFILASAIVLALWFASLLAGCASKQGPAGPDGPEGLGNQRIHNLNVSPATASASYDIAAPEVVVDPARGVHSTVICYIVLATAPGVELAIPTTRAEADGTTTDYSYHVKPGVVTVSWRNSGATVPPVAQIVVTVLNPL